jgi:hypothetical protein
MVGNSRTAAAGAQQQQWQKQQRLPIAQAALKEFLCLSHMQVVGVTARSTQRTEVWNATLRAPLLSLL